MLEIDHQIIVDTLDEIRHGSSGVEVRIDTHDGDMCRVEVQFAPGAISFSIARLYTSAERMHFYSVGYFRPVALYLCRLQERNPDLVGAVVLWVEDIIDEAGLVFCTTGHADQLAIPDPIFLRTHGYQEMRDFMLHGGLSWAEKCSTVFWRGSTTGMRPAASSSWTSLQRVQLCCIANASQSVPYDVGLSDIVQMRTSEIEEVRRSGLLRPGVSQFAFQDYKLVIDIDGNASSWPGLFTKLLMGSVVVKVGSQQSFTQWYYDDLQPWTHYVPVLADMSDLDEKCRWALRDDGRAEAIAAAGQRFAQALTVESTYAGVAQNLRRFMG